MGSAKKPDVTKEEIEQARSLWTGFTQLMKWGIISAIICLSLMALTLV